jgi:hypothetical protein
MIAAAILLVFNAAIIVDHKTIIPSIFTIKLHIIQRAISPISVACVPKAHLTVRVNCHILISLSQLPFTSFIETSLFAFSLSERSLPSPVVPTSIQPATIYKNKKPNDKAAIANTGTNASHTKSFTFNFFKNPSLSPIHSLLFLKKYNKPATGENIVYNQIYIHLLNKTNHNAIINIAYTRIKSKSKTIFIIKSIIVLILSKSNPFSSAS